MNSLHIWRETYTIHSLQGGQNLRRARRYTSRIFAIICFALILLCSTAYDNQEPSF